MQINWQDLSATSHYLTAVAVRNALAYGDVSEANQGINELIDALSRADRRAVRSLLIVLMAHVLKWKLQPEKRSVSWVATIRNCRDNIEELQEDTPSITNASINALWEKAMKSALEQAEDDMKIKVSKSETLTWKEVFEEEYKIPFKN